MSAQDEDELWRSIVDNYGERPELDEAPETAPAAAVPSVAPEPLAEVEDRFVPPPPPPLPPPGQQAPGRLDRRVRRPDPAARLPGGRDLAAPAPRLRDGDWFVGGFVYLVLLMPRGPRDPDDDGARL